MYVCVSVCACVCVCVCVCKLSIFCHAITRKMLQGSFWNFSCIFGVPQGSHCGPILFIIFINDIKNVIIFSKFLRYADDIKIFIRVKSVLDASNLQRDLENITKWASDNDLSLNIDKCKQVSFVKNHSPIVFQYKIHQSALESVHSIKDLGVYFDSAFSFSTHIQHTYSKAYSALGFLIRSSKDFKNVYTIVSLFRSNVLSILLYGSPVWSPYYNVNSQQIEKIQRSLRYASYKTDLPMEYNNHNYSTISRKLKIPTIKSIHDYNDIILTFKILNNSISSKSLLDHFKVRQISYNIRNFREIKESNSNSNYAFNSSITRLRRTWNKLPERIKSINSLFTFKVKAKEFCFKFYWNVITLNYWG